MVVRTWIWQSGWLQFLLLSLVCGCVVCGCGGSDTPSSNSAPPDATVDAAAVKPEPAVAPPAASDELAPTPQDSASTTTERRPDEVWEDESGRRYLGSVPYDVFFDHPLAVAAEGQSVATTAGEPPSRRPDSEDAASVESSPVSDSTDEPMETAGPGWDSVLPVEVLESEIKSIRNFLNQKLQSVGAYNSSVTMIPAKAATLAALAAIAEEHGGRISWKNDAGYIRDLAASMNDSVLQRGPKDQRRLLAVFENLVDTLNRSRPSDLEPPEPDTGLADVADMRLLMMRLEQAEQRLRTEVNESAFESRRDVVRHEAAMLSTLMRAMTTESYGFADDTEFVGHGQQIMKAGHDMQAAAEAGDYGAFELALSRLAGTCQACHRDYKNN